MDSDNTLFFTTMHGRRQKMSDDNVARFLKKYAEAAHMKCSDVPGKVTPHMFRHSFATYLIEEGVDISCVQPILGHSSIKTTQIYIHVAAGMQAEILRSMHPRNKMELLGLVS